MRTEVVKQTMPTPDIGNNDNEDSIRTQVVTETHPSSDKDNNDRDDTQKITVQQNISLKESISRRLSVREKTDNVRENKFVVMIVVLCIVIILVCIIMWLINPNKFVLDLMFIPETFILVFFESLWHMVLSFMVIKYDIKINYSRKLAHLFRIPKYFLIGYLPGFDKNEITILLIFVLSQILYMLMFHRKVREKIYLFEFIFIAQNRVEDQPSTLQFQVTEDFMRFFVYYPITIWITYKKQNEAIIYIPQIINSIGDGLAEPVGITFGKHKYKTFALFYDGKWFNGQFTRSFEGSLCVFSTTFVVIIIEYFLSIFSDAQLLYLLMTMPFYMTIAEAIAPHTNDGPFLALTGCFILMLGYEIIDC
eukprot:111257_1